MNQRVDFRNLNELRQISYEINPLSFAQGSVIFSTGMTKVLCSITIENRVPRFLEGQNTGWLTAEYSMLPGATNPRSSRENVNKGRSKEISRLIGRTLRSAVDLNSLGEITINVDCDVLQADGGTRTASITGSYIALYIALTHLLEGQTKPITEILTPTAAISVGLFDGIAFLDLCYEEDSRADSDFNIVMGKNKGTLELVEIQGSAEGKRFSRKSFDSVLDIATKGVSELMEIQNQIITQSIS